MNILPVGAELFYVESQTDRRTEGHDETSSGF